MHAWSLGLAGGESILAGEASLCLVAGPSQRRARRTGPGSKVSSVAPSGNIHTSIIPFYPDSWPPAPLTLTTQDDDRDVLAQCARCEAS